MLTDEELAELAAGIGAGPHIAASLLASLELAAGHDDEEAMSVGVCPCPLSSAVRRSLERVRADSSFAGCMEAARWR